MCRLSPVNRAHLENRTGVLSKQLSHQFGRAVIGGVIKYCKSPVRIRLFLYAMNQWCQPSVAIVRRQEYCDLSTHRNTRRSASSAMLPVHFVA